ncbi:MAG: RDD family protein [Ectothiorhodospiraceae bacterium]|nr:RDD family protein [Ectothiorhodospiraceae bacterium]
MTYDTMLLAAVLIIGTFAILPLTGGEEIPAHWIPLFQAYVLVLGFGFFALFWLWGGQTLGMKAWHLYVVRQDGGRLGWQDVFKRLLAGVVTLGPVGLISVPFHHRRYSLCDMLSGTVILHHPPAGKA